MSEYFAAPPLTSNSTTANAGTNLNTSALALEAGGNLAAIYAKLITTLAVTQSGTWSVGSKNQDGSGTAITSTNVSGKQGLDVNVIAGGGSSGPTNYSLETGGNLASILAKLTSGVAVTGTFYQATQPVSGTVGISGTVPVSGTFYQVTQPVSLASLPSLATGSNTIGAISNTAFTANAGTNLNTSALALETGGNLSTIATNTGKIPSKGTATIANSTPVNIASDQTVPVSGTFYQDTQPVSLASVPSHPVTNAGTFAVQNTAATPTGTNSIGTVGLNAGTNSIGSITNTAFTANAGTNLNTSALALESGGNLATCATKMSDGTQTASIIIPSSFKTGQAKIAITGTAVQIGSNVLTQGVLISSLSTNAASITIGTSSGLTNTVDGTGNGAILPAGSTKSIAATNTNLIWINGTAGDIISFIGS
jgi:hypothetical protein